MNTAEIVKNSKLSKLSHFREGVFYYITDNGFEFMVPLSDVSGATLFSEDKTIFFMRWIRAQVELNESKPKTGEDSNRKWLN